ncbi:asparagine synthase-related protein [Streptomyces sp. NPDC094049]|uniref:asparagine synthase-related protein n=1 Tax=Streptomyces sp. NPDC094049 TaxID=3154987 RepID=UPI003332B4C7
MRYIVGATEVSGFGWRPKGAVDVPGLRGVWASEFEPGEIRQASIGDTVVVVAGSCLATWVELERAAVEAARTQSAAPVTALPGVFVAMVRTGGVWRVVGDRAGTVRVFWLSIGGRVVWGTAAAPLAALGGCEPDPAVLLGQMSLHGVDVLDGASHFRGVRRVRPGHALVLEEGRPPRTEPTAPSGSPLGIEDAAPLVRGTVVEAVERRTMLSGRVSADLSGGMDSSVVASIASARTRLLAVTYTDARMKDEDDLYYARKVAAELPGVRHEVVEGGAGAARHFGGLDDPHRLPLTDTPTFSLGLVAMKEAQLARPVREGMRMHLTGRGGDDVLEAVPSVAVDQFRAGQRAAAWRRVAALARLRRTSGAGMLAQAARTAATPYPRALTDLAGQLAAGQVEGPSSPARVLAWCGATGALPWLTLLGRSMVAELVGERANGADARQTPGSLHERLALELMGDGHATFDQMSRTLWSLPVHAPLLDNRVVDLCHAVPGWERSRPGQFKPLARAAFAGLVPDVLLKRTTKTAFTGSLFDGLRAHAPALRRVLAGSVLVQAGLLDEQKVRNALDAGARGEPVPLAALHALVVTEIWLGLLPLGRHVWWERTDETQVAA